MVDESTTNKHYPLPHPSNVESQDVTRIATAISMIDSDVTSCLQSVDTMSSTVSGLETKALKIPNELVGQVDTSLSNIIAGRYIVVNEDATGFSTVEGGGGEGGKKGEILIKKSDTSFDTTWLDPRTILKKAPTIKETETDVQLPNNCTMILEDEVETESDDVPRQSLTQLQINSDATADSSCSYILCDTIDDTAEDDSDIATNEKFGRVKIGTGININDGTISVPVIGLASKQDFGMVRVGSGLNIEDGVVSTQPYPHADSETFGLVKPGSDFYFDLGGALNVVKRSKDIIYQTMTTNAVNNGVVEIVPTCARYRAFVNSDILFSFDYGDFVPDSDISFDLEIIADGTYIVNFGSDVIWDLPCAGVNAGTTIIHFEKLLGETQFRGTLKSTETTQIKLLTSNTTDDINDDYICGHNGTGLNACACLATRVYHEVYSFSNPAENIWYIDFARSTYVEYFEYGNNRSPSVVEYFYIEGSVDAKNWKRLFAVENERLETTSTLTKHGYFKHYRIRARNMNFTYFRWYGFEVEDDRYELQRVMLIMQSDSANGYEITSSGLTSGNLYNLTTDDTNTWANFETRLNGEYWVKYELPVAQSVDLIDLAARRSTESNRMPTWFKIEGSNDDTNWTTILERAYLTQWYGGESKQYWINNQTPYKFYRLLSIEQPTAYFSLSRFRLYKKVDGAIFGKKIPKLSSASQGGYEITASSTCGSDHWPYLAFDGSSGTKWASANGDAVGGWIQIKFPTETLCTTAWLTSRNDKYYGQAATDFTILGSNDGENFDTLKTITGQTWTQGEEKKITFLNEIPYLYYRVQAQAIQNGEGYFALSEVNFGSELREYKKELNTSRKLTPIMTANSQDGFVLTANSIYRGQKVYNPFEAFNNTVSDASSWTTKTQSGWIQIELPVADKANMFKMSGGYSNEEPDSFILYGSNDGENYDELLNSGALTWTHNETKTWDLNNDTAYKFYKVEAVNTKSAYITISEIQLIEHITTREY